MRTATLAFSIFAALTLAACEKKEDTSATATPAPTAAAPAGNGIGVAECDDFLAKYEACLTEHVPDSARAALRQSLDATRAGWKQAAATPAGRDSLKTACEQMRSTSRQSLQAYGCSDF